MGKLNPSTKSPRKRALKVEDGAFFTAVQGGEKIRGVLGISNNWRGDVYLFRNSTVGDEICSEDNEGFSRVIEIEAETDTDFQEILDSEEIKDFKVVNDQRQIKVIQRDMLPEILGYGITLTDDGTAKFGCGAVEVDKKEIEAFLRVKKIIESINVSDKTIYDDVVEKIEDEGHDVDEITTEEVEQLLKRM